MRQGRPLRFLVLVLGGWVVVRAAVLLPGLRSPVIVASPWPPLSQPSVLPDAPVPPAAHRFPPGIARLPGGSAGADDMVPLVRCCTALPAELPSRLDRHDNGMGLEIAAPTPASKPPSARRAIQDVASTTGASKPERTIEREPVARPVPATAGRFSFARLSGDTWLVARPAGGENLAFGQLGASQAGMRLSYRIDQGRRIAVSARASAPLNGAGREAAAGLDWQPSRLPLHLLAEQRLPLDGGTPRPAVQLIGGGTLRLPLRLSAEGYAQAGGVYRRGGFADGSARLSRAVLRRTLFTLDLGAGGWGAAQRQVSRLDLGPTIGLTLPARDGTLRLAVDYRLRVAGRARPGSGPAVSVGSSF